jgi:hypothetical protein
MMNIQISDYIADFWELENGRKLKHKSHALREHNLDIRDFTDFREPLDIIILAYRNLHPQYMLTQDYEHKIIKGDLINSPGPQEDNPIFRMARWVYPQRIYGQGDKNQSDTLSYSDISHLLHACKIFDKVLVIAAFEHFLQVTLVVQECNRVLKPSGIIWLLLLLSKSPFGGHNVTVMEIPVHYLPKSIDPCAYLPKRWLPFCVPMDDWRIQQYLDASAQHFEF